MTWRSYPDDRLIEDRDGYVVIVPANSDTIKSLYCSVCRALYRDSDDEQASVEFDCCHLCALRWAHPRREAWASGWRPNHDDVLSELEQRPHLNVSFEPI